MPEISGMIQQFLEGNIKTLSAEPVIESKTITENGTYTAPEGVDGYSPVVVNVEPVIESKTITENGTYTPESGVDGFAPVIVNVPSTQPVIESKTITENGTYTAPSGVDGYSPITVNVPLPQNAYLLKSVSNLPQPIASFNDGEDMVMPTLKVAIEPQQEGSGDPSPTNIRPISGWTEVDMSVSGVNVWDEEWENGSYSNITGAKTVNANKVRNKNLISVLPNTEYYCKLPLSLIALNVYWFDKNKQFLFADDEYGIRQNSKFTVPNGCYYLGWSTFGNNCTSYNNDISINYPSTDTSYHAYNGSTYTIDLDGTRYGVDLDVINGIGREYKEYPSYNGETLIGPWISDRDAYAEGTTPTIGAQVVDKGDISTFNTIPTAVNSLRGVNNVWADTGDITDAEYFSKED